MLNQGGGEICPYEHSPHAGKHATTSIRGNCHFTLAHPKNQPLSAADAGSFVAAPKWVIVTSVRRPRAPVQSQDAPDTGGAKGPVHLHDSDYRHYRH